VLALAAVAVAGAPARGNAPRAAPQPDRVLVLVGRRGGVPASWVRRLRRSDAVDALTEVSRTQWLLRRSRDAAGRVVDAPRRGYAIPLDTFVVDPHAYARVTGDDALRPLRRGRVLLPERSARLRRLSVGDHMTFAGGRRVVVAGVVADSVGRGAELIATTADVPRARRRATAVVVATRHPAAAAKAIPHDARTHVGRLDDRPDSATTAGSITHPVELKRRFGEFAVRLPYGADWIDIDPRWVRRTIVTRTVPILGAVTCHRAMIAPLRRALGLLRREGLARLVDRGDYAGCFAARRIPGSGSLSLHAWGLAADINASENPQGSAPRQDRRVVAAFERTGFTWGGVWPTAPDGMHFEWHGAAGG
jgi:D-alanyl-D-alanine carboxypeptidase